MLSLSTIAMASEKQVAIVVGSSRGIGRQIAVDLAKNGYSGELSDSKVKVVSSAEVMRSK